MQPVVDRRKLLASAAAAALLAAPRGWASLGPGGALRVGLTGVVVREYMRSFNRLADYLALRLGRPVEFVLRRSYRDIMDLLERGELDAAWICGYPFVKPRNPEYLSLLVAPVYRGSPFYRSLLIVPSASSAASIIDLRGSVFAFSDPDSNSGYLVPRTTLADAGFNPDQFFRMSFFTYSHAETVLAVARSVADGGSVDSYVYNTLQKFEPETVSGTRVIAQSRQFGFPPIVVRNDLAPQIRDRFRDALIGMASDAQAVPVLALLDLDGFTEVSPALYDPIREMAKRFAKAATAEVPLQ
ncbi:MAG: phosphate/phosphite/phosphonate ABC transporter substrate-binding protein [Phaeovulum sp.]|uniref:substrate-binding domain-containing protein n=1 Tax=Phaeovulum sp. TaxID=2934796 RepID=UPI00272F0088|nr:phosphate/phosphite/phosphonate ABC transporter substrate-binding protein [Phaeovulum sp.]MDP2063867.1 phosphate/phosphite/phosphonate ABC transporter substrate-binding protein [Phaeovulum sp.]